MPTSSPPRTDAETALEAAGVCVWEWSSDDNRLSLRRRGPNLESDLEGDWRLEDFIQTLEGLSGQRLAERLKAGGEATRLDLTLMTGGGKRLHFLGAFSRPDRAQGLLFGAAQTVAAPTGENAPVEAVYQPIIRLSDGRIAGFEALARWRDGEGMLRTAGALDSTPGEMATRELALSMLDQAGSALADWTHQFPELGVFVQVNLTGADLYRATVMERVSALVQSGPFPPRAFRIELTEQMALRDFNAGVAAATALQASGAALVLDDFGSGHSSLAWLAAIPATGIKLDAQLVQMAGSPRIDTILKSMVELAHDLGMTVTAEGVETLDRVEFLKEIGCDYAQGFAYAYPMEKSKADRFLISQMRLGDFNVKS